MPKATKTEPARPDPGLSQAPSIGDWLAQIGRKIRPGRPQNGHRPQAAADRSAIQVVELPASISAAGLRQTLLQVNSRRVALVVPADSGALASAGLVAFQVLKRQADAQGLGVAIVTRNGRIRRFAADAGLPVFGSVQGAQKTPWPVGRSGLGYRPPAPHRDSHFSLSEHRRRWFTARLRRAQLLQGDRRPWPMLLETALLAVVLILAVVAVSALLAFIVPVATVTLIPAQEPLAARVTITARSDIEAPDASRNLVPARRIGQRVEGEDATSATGARSAPDQPAQGVVVFTNRQSTAVLIPADTPVATSTGTNLRFRTLAPAELPGGVGAQVSVAVEALEPGPAGNVRAFTINTVEGSLAVSTNVFNPQATYGGNVKQVAVVTQGDKDRLRSQVLQRVTQEAYLALGELLGEGEFVPPETVGVLVVAETYDRFTDEAADQVSLRLRLLATALAVDGAAADQLALRALGEAIPRRGRLLSDSVRYTRGPATVSEEEDGVSVITFDVTASGVVVLDIDPAAVRGGIRGRAPADARRVMQENWRLQAPPVISLGPDWLLPILRRFDFAWLPLPVADRVPWVPFRIQVRVEFAS